MEQPHLPGEQLLLQLLEQWAQEGSEQGQKTRLALATNMVKDVSGREASSQLKTIFNYFCFCVVRARSATSQMRLGS